MFSKILKQEQILLNQPMKKYTTFRIGGNADFVLLPKTVEEIQNCIECCENNSIKYYIIGNGSNLLVSDKGFRGAIIRFGSNFSDIDIDTNTNVITAKAGAILAKVANLAYENSLTGIEFAGGIPGTVGGGVCMNAGAYDGELKDFITSVTVLQNNKIITLTNEECEFEYRNSKILKNSLVVLEVTLELKNGIKDEILSKMKGFNKLRNEKQPVEFPSAGSTFKRPIGNFAGKLIMDSGLRGKSVGDACVSEKHCGFIINKNDASFDDVINLIELVKQEVSSQFGVTLEEEVRIVGER